MPSQFTAAYKPKSSRPQEPILIGRDLSQARVTVDEAKQLVKELQGAIQLANTFCHVTPQGTVLQDHFIGGFHYFTIPQQMPV